MLSRSASNLYWMARYFERAESTARLLNACFQPGTPFAGDLEKLYDLPLQVQSAHNDFIAQQHILNMNNVINFMVSGNSQASIKYCLEMARENARSERSRMSNEVWEVVNQTWLEFNNWQKQPLHLFKEWLQQRSFLLQGTINNTMPANLSRRFLQIGMFIERADQTLRILEAEVALRTFSNQSEYYHWNIILRSVGSLEAYQETFVDIPAQELVLQFLLFNKTIPRSVRCCIEHTERVLQLIGGQNRKHPLKESARLLVKLQFDKLDDINKIGQRAYIESLQKEIFTLAAAIEEGHFVSP
ncbi:MAG TPA: alpha-E domain-containing protein [Aquella sp.]|nr:alpha-E domain-containing protein [Aquella sp.]